MNRCRSVPALLAAALLATLATPVGAAAAPQLRHQLLVNGDFTLFGNTLAHDCAAGVAPTVGTVGNCGNNTSDSGVDVFWRSDTGVADRNVTLAQSRSTAVLGLPVGATVRYARLYWAGTTGANDYDAAANLVTPDATDRAITADHGIVFLRATGEYWYQSSADVTAIVQGLAEPRGAYAFYGGESRLLRDLTSNTAFFAWWVVVFYEDPADTALRQLSIFDGLDYVSGGAPANVELGGFLVPSGGFDAKLGVVTYEGDASITGDQLFFEGYQSTGPAPTPTTPLTDAQNPANNFFNGTRSWLGAAQSVAGDLPRMPGTAGSMMSFDFDVVDLVAPGVIHAGDDSAVISATSTGDVYALGAFITSINTLKPSFITTTKTATNLTRAEGVFAGDLIEYTIDTENTGNDPSVQTVLVDPLPVGVTYFPGTLEIVSGAIPGTMTDAAGDDQGDYDPATRTVAFRLGSGATWDSTAYPGGTMAIGETAQVRFRVTIDAGASGILQNQATVIAAGLNGEPPRYFPSNPPLGTGPTNVPVDLCFLDGDCGGATPACWTAPVPNVCVGCTDDAYCSGETPICDLAAHLCVGLTTIAPGAQAKSTVAGTPAPFPMTLTSNLASPDVYDLDVSVGACTWPVELRTTGGALVATFASGAWAIEPGGDTNANGSPDLGSTAASGGTTSFVLRLAPPVGTPNGSQCIANLLATGETGGLTASASASLTVGSGATFTPDYVGASAKTVSRGGDVGFPGVVQNNRDADLSYALAASMTSSGLTPVAPVFYSDPNGDGDWSDGAIITSTGTLAAWGGRGRVVLVLRAETSTGTPLATGTLVDLTATATNGATVATQTSQARVQYAATYSDAARTVVQGFFAPCDTVYLGAKLLPAGFPFALEWYAKANPVRGTDAPYRLVDPWPVSGGAGTDQLVVPADALGTWTVKVIQKTTPTVTELDTITFTVERAGSFLSLAVAPRIGMADGLSVSAQVRNQNLFAPFANSAVAYAVTDGTNYMDGTGAFSATPGTAHNTSSLSVAAGAAGSDAWATGSPAWPAPGLYSVDAEWRLSCGGTPTIATATAAFEVVPSAPSIEAPLEGATVNTSTPTLSGAAFPGATVIVTIGGATCSTTADATTGAYACTFSTPLADGARSATAAQTVGGATSEPSAPRSFTVDATTSVSISAPLDDATLNGAAAPGGTVSFAGANELGATVTVAIDGGPAFAATVAGGGWSYSRVLADGFHTAVATATDGQGNTATASVTFTVDATTYLTFTEPADGATLNALAAPGGLVTVRGTAEDGSTVDVVVGSDSATVVPFAGLWEASFVLADGPYTASATTTDASGNTAAASITFELDTLDPSVSIAAPLDGTTFNATTAPGGSVTLTGTNEVGATVTVSIDGGAGQAATVSGTSWSLNVTLADGSHSATATATDSAGNSATTGTTSFSIDTAAPAVAITAPANGTTFNATTAPGGSVTLTGTNEVGATVTVSIDGGAGQAATVSGTSWSLNVTLADGSHSATATATDSAGNSATTGTTSFSIDTAAPSVVITGPTHGAATVPGTVVITVTADPGATVQVTIDGSTYTATEGASGSYTVSVTLPEGDWTVSATASDPAGNEGSASTTAFSTVTGAPSAIDANVTGGGGCSCGPEGGANPASILLLLLALPFAPRRRRPAAG